MKQDAVKSAIQNYIATNRVDATSRDLTRLYATSSTAGACADLRSESVAQVPMRVKSKRTGEVVEDDHPLNAIFSGAYSFQDIMKRSELAMYFWGRNLLQKNRNAFYLTKGLTWVNPNIYQLDSLISGLRGFRVYASSRYQIEHVAYIPLQDAVYMHEVDFDDDYEGVSPIERAFLEASGEVELAQTVLAVFRNMAIPAAIAQPAADSKPSPGSKDALTGMLRRLVQGTINAGRTIVSPDRWEWIQLQNPLKDQSLDIISANARKAVCIASRVPLELIEPSAANYATFEGARRAWGNSWLVPRVKWYAAAFTAQIASEYGDEWVVEPDFDDVPFLKEDAAARVNVVTAKLTGTMITIGQARKELGDKVDADPVLDDLYLVQGIPVPKAVLPTLWQYHFAPAQTPPTNGVFSAFSGGLGQTPAISGSNALATLSAPQTPDLRLLERPPETTIPALPAPAKAADESAFVYLSLADDPAVKAVQDQLRAQLAGVDGIEWQDPTTFHVTLVYCDQATDGQLTGIARQVSGKPVSVRSREIGVFENGEERAVHLVIDPASVKKLQAAIYDEFKAYALPLSKYSDPAQYKPHVTLCYLPAGVDVPTVSVDVNTKGEHVVFGRDDYEEFAAVSLSAFEILQELKAWQVIAARERPREGKGVKWGRGYPFQITTPGFENVQAFTRAALDNGDPIVDVFAQARALVAESVKKKEANQFVTPEEYLAYWGNYDTLMQEIGDDWLDRYMDEVWTRLRSGGNSFVMERAASILEQMRSKLVAEWVGTDEQPGSLARIVLAGMAAGQVALERNRSINPALPAKSISLTVDWSLLSREARDFVRNYTFDLIKQVNQTTIDQIRAALDKWIASGEPLDALWDALELVVKNPVRARMIAQTETTRAYNQGAERRWQEAGITKIRHQTVRDRHVCTTCAPLHNKIGELGKGVYSDVEGRYVTVPVHVSCRCFQKPVLDEPVTSLQDEAQSTLDRLNAL